MALPPPTSPQDELPLRIAQEELIGTQQFNIDSRLEIESTLKLLADHHELVCMYVDNTDRFAVSTVLACDGHRLMLDEPMGEMRAALMGAQTCLCVSSHNRVKLQFEVGALQRIEWDEESALACALPSRIVRFQRRDAYRLNVPLGRPLSCFFPSGRGDDVEVSLVDISIGGVGILGYPPGLKLANGQRYANVRIELPNAGLVVATVEICASFEVTLRNGIRTVRTGGRFVNLPGTAQTVIQRYITRVERERIARTVRNER